MRRAGVIGASYFKGRRDGNPEPNLESPFRFDSTWLGFDSDGSFR